MVERAIMCTIKTTYRWVEQALTTTRYICNRAGIRGTVPPLDQGLATRLTAQAGISWIS